MKGYLVYGTIKALPQYDVGRKRVAGEGNKIDMLSLTPTRWLFRIVECMDHMYSNAQKVPKIESKLGTHK